MKLFGIVETTCFCFDNGDLGACFTRSQKCPSWTREGARWLKTSAAFAKGLNSVPTIHVQQLSIVCKSSSKSFDTLLRTPMAPILMCTHTYLYLKINDSLKTKRHMHLRNYSYIHKLSFKISKFYQIWQEQSQFMNNFPRLFSMRVITLLL